MICEIICVDGFLCMSHLDIVHMLSAYVHVIHILSEHMHIIRTLSAVALDIFLPNRQCWCHPYVISSTLYISYHLQLSFHTLSTQTHFVNAIWMLFAHVHIICLWSLTLLAYPIIHNLVSVHCLHTHTSSMSSVYCLQMHMLYTSHFYCCYLHMLWFFSRAVSALWLEIVWELKSHADDVRMTCVQCADDTRVRLGWRFGWQMTYVICMLSACHPQAGTSSAHHLQRSSWSAWTWTIFLLWQELVIEWNLWQECWVVSFQDDINDLRDNLCWWFSLHCLHTHT